MKTTVKQAIKIAFSLALILAIALHIVFQLTLDTSGSERYFAGSAEEYCQSLMDAGFPSDYAIALTELHMLHPNWTFLPLDITGQKSTYTWEYVIEQETTNPETNLISASNTYAAYHHETNQTKYDSGYYQASVSAVEYFMDPRNFLNETDIFLFFDLSSKIDPSEAAVDAVLNGTFMQNAKLENGKTYTEYFCQVGAELGINPVYLAVKARQEQGIAGTSPVISGSCGTKLWEFYRDQTKYTDSGAQVIPPDSGYTESGLKALNGYYNFYNVKASGSGLFKIYYNAMDRALVGTEEMKSTWNGNSSWNTKWKSIYGGAYLLKKNYVDQYQPTVYLQKFNVDSRSNGNFYRQYMQAVSGGLTEARTLYQSFASMDTLDGSHTFLIPVYGNMPETPCADPANGNCTILAQATTRYDYQVKLNAPNRFQTESTAVYTEKELYENESMKIVGSISHSYGLTELQYAWDFGEWQTASHKNQMDFSVSADFSADNTHILIIRGKAKYDHSNSEKKHNAYVLCAVIYVKIVEPPKVTLTYRVGNVEESRILTAGTTVTLPQSNASDFVGWIGSDGTFFPSGANFSISENLTYTALFLDFRMLDGAALPLHATHPHLRFSAVIDNADYQKLMALPQSAFSISSHITSKQSNAPLESAIQPIRLFPTSFGDWIRLDVDTVPISTQDYDTDFFATVSITLHYSNGEQKTISALQSDNERNVREIAIAALSDTDAAYSDETIAFLQMITNAT